MSSSSDQQHHHGTGFMVFHSNRMETLRDLLVTHLQNHPLAVLSPETILVQSHGMRQWLSEALADDRALGVCAATRLVLPSTQLWQLYRAVLGDAHLPLSMPLDKAPLAWRIWRMLPTWLQDPRFAALAHYLGDDTQGLRGYQLSQQLADVLDGYQNHRADWLDDWALGKDRLGKQPLPEAHLWQAAMWRDLLADLKTSQAQDGPFPSRSEVHQGFLRALQNHPPGHFKALPPRLMVFGITALPMQTMQALVALGRHMQVLMFLHNPCEAHWGHLSEDQATGGHPLLASWGKQGRDFLHAIDAFDPQDAASPSYHRVDLFIDPRHEATEMGEAPTVLQQLQFEILHLNIDPDAPPMAPDASLSFVQTHSAQREVEVLHDRILTWLNDDPSLMPEDIMVMVPDMATFAPAIQAVFGRHHAGNDAGRDLPFAITDHTPRSHPLVQALDTLLQLPQWRISLGEWLQLFQVAAVQARYGLTDTQVERLHTWLSEAGVRWGLDATQRETAGMPSHLPDADQNSWVFGLRRLLLGYALGPTSSDGVWFDTLAQPGLDGLDGQWVDAVLQWLDDIAQSRVILQTPRRPSEWVTCWRDLCERFFLVRDPVDQQVMDRMLAPLEDWLADCQLADFDQPVTLPVLRQHWLAQLDQRGLHRRLASGGVSFATLMPMRAIPFKVVCLLGMNDSSYPRSPTPRDFDLMALPQLARPGDRARREDDRYLFLEALLSARQRLYVSWQGCRTSDHAPLPPSVLVSQLLEHLNTRFNPNPRNREAWQAPLQPLQAFSRRYFSQGFHDITFAAEWSPWPANAPAKPNIENPPSLGLPPPNTLDQRALLTLLRQPAEVYFKHHLQVSLDLPDSPEDDSEPFEWQGLHGYLGRQQVVQSETPQVELQHLKMRGELALAAMGQDQQTQLLALREQLWRSVSTWLHAQDTPVPPQLWRQDTDGGRLTLTWGGEWPRWRQRADGSLVQIDWRPSKVLAKDALASLWLGHLAACASGHPTQSVQSGEDGVLVLVPLSPEKAQALLQDMVALYQEAWAKPLPLPSKTALRYLHAWTQALAKDPDHPMATQRADRVAHEQAQATFEGQGDRDGEWARNPCLQRLYQRYQDLDLDRFTQLAHRLYQPMHLASQAMAAESLDEPAEDAA